MSAGFVRKGHGHCSVSSEESAPGRVEEPQPSKADRMDHGQIPLLLSKLILLWRSQSIGVDPITTETHEYAWCNAFATFGG